MCSLRSSHSMRANCSDKEYKNLYMYIPNYSYFCKISIFSLIWGQPKFIVVYFYVYKTNTHLSMQKSINIANNYYRLKALQIGVYMKKNNSA